MPTCTICDKEFSSTFNLNRHIDTMHDDEDDDVDSGNDEEVEDSVDEGDEDEEGEDDEEGDEDDDDDDDDEEGKTVWETYSDETGELESLTDKRTYVIKRYIEDVEYYKQFRNDPIHKNIMATKRKFLDDADENENLGDYEALRLAITKRQYLIYDATNLENEEEEKEENME